MLAGTRSFSLLLALFCALPLLEALLFPTASSISMVSSVSVPVVEFFPDRRILFDWCFSMAYDLPNRVSSFYTIPIWPGIPKKKRDISNAVPPLSPDFNIAHWYQKYDRKTDGNRHPGDFSAGELYQGIEDFLVGYGFNETCLLRSVCELAQHPFDEAHQNIVTDLITFFLTPSLHEGFDATEELYRQTYETAERSGFLGKDCAKLYSGCQKDFLGTMTKVIMS